MKRKLSAILILLAVFLLNGSLAEAADDGARKLVISGFYEDEICDLFLKENPDVVLEFSDEKFLDAESLKQSVLTRDDAIDIYTINNDWGLRDLAEKGFLVDLSSQESIRDAYVGWYSEIQEAVSYQERIVAYPVGLHMELWGINREIEHEWPVFTEPQSALDFIQGVSRTEELREEFAVNYIMEVPQKARLIRHFIEQELLIAEKTGAYPRLNRPQVLAIFDAIKDMPESQPIEDEFAYDLIAQMPTYISMAEDPLDSSSAYQLLCPYSITGEKAINTLVTVMIVNPNSEHIDLALAYLAFRAEHESPLTRYLMSPDLNKPVENPEFIRLQNDRQARVAALYARLKQAQDEEEIDKLELQIADEKSGLEDEDHRWLISEKRLAEYRDVAQDMVIVKNSPFLGISGERNMDLLIELVYPFIDGRIDAQRLAIQIDERIQMVYEEN